MANSFWEKICLYCIARKVNSIFTNVIHVHVQFTVKYRNNKSITIERTFKRFYIIFHKKSHQIHLPELFKKNKNIIPSKHQNKRVDIIVL